ncbi:MAG: ADP-L-glycero-D-manno-heptose-6-epimerase [Candidatus Nomurabacteria bacterium GW2011_GWA2_40_9]|uniref:ADP-L-glycero-D-manno-heptose-6-epimerase n=1 Tax=Candidatus Nomurabacteria bacterium GW2011_GWA2_40_9 TaxID=1618734 RepID=A0A0G0TQB9_9BACT|nr:MAG: ADP-L-glycero-D-manno-heptose-6-epimerase [Candidatus Nomurabacteria bacterium GW2011_GWA2_40_9]
MKCLVTGGTGFIGSNLALELEKQGHDVVVVNNVNSKNKSNLKGFKGKIIEKDISYPFEIDGKFDVIFHEAAISDPRFEDDNEMIRTNVEGFKNIIQSAIKKNAKLIYASTASLYGNGPIPMKEDQKKELLSAYAKSKLAMDNLAEKYFDKMHIVGLRYFNVYGKNEASKGRPASMIYHLGKQMKEGKRPRIFKYGEHKRDNIYVKDVVTATIKAVSAKKSGIYNVGTGIATSFNDIVKILNDVLGTSFEPEYADNPYKETYQNNTQADTTNAEKYLGFKARWALRQGIEDYKEDIE